MLLRNTLKSFSTLIAAGTLLVAVACTKKAEPTAAAVADAVGSGDSVAEAVARGKKVYMANCIACHNINPKQDGGIGPANWGSSRELLYSKIVLNKYPEGYTPKRPSKAMAPLPHLEKDIDDLHAFLNN